jgi:hypothetical protein
MARNWLLAEASRTSRNRILLAALGVAAVIGLLGYNTKYLAEYFRGPAEVVPADLERAASAEAMPRRWVRVQVAAIEDTGITEVTVRTKRGVERSRSVSASYHAALLGNRALLVKARGETTPGKLLVGELRPLEAGAADALFQGPEGAKMRALFVPMTLDVHDYREDGHWILLIATGGFLWALVYGWIAFGRMSDPRKHPALVKAARWGGLDEMGQVLAEDAAEAIKVGAWRLGPRYLQMSSMFNLEVHKLDELLWAYYEVTKKKLYYVIPAGQSSALVLKWRSDKVKIDLKEDAVVEALSLLTTNQPWVVYGWSKEAETLYNRQRAVFASQVIRGKQRYEQERQAAAVAAVPAVPEFAPTQPQGLALT